MEQVYGVLVFIATYNNISAISPIMLHARGRRGRDGMVVQSYNYLCNQ
jgi:hypothetical protein